MFKPGDTVAFDPSSFNKGWWDSLSTDQKVHYYGDLYDFEADKPRFFTFICEHSPQVGHCVLISLDKRNIETMRHTNNFRLVFADEC